MAPRSQPATPGIVAARLLLASVFIVMGGWRLVAVAQGAALPNSAVVASAIEAVLGLLVAFGWRLRWTALLAALLMVADALLSHRFWTLRGALRDAQLLQFMKNVGLVGGFLLLSQLGGGRHRR